MPHAERFGHQPLFKHVGHDIAADGPGFAEARRINRPQQRERGVGVAVARKIAGLAVNTQQRPGSGVVTGIEAERGALFGAEQQVAPEYLVEHTGKPRVGRSLREPRPGRERRRQRRSARSHHELPAIECHGSSPREILYQGSGTNMACAQSRRQVPFQAMQ